MPIIPGGWEQFHEKLPMLIGQSSRDVFSRPRLKKEGTNNFVGDIDHKAL